MILTTFSSSSSELSGLVSSTEELEIESPPSFWCMIIRYFPFFRWKECSNGLNTHSVRHIGLVHLGGLVRANCPRPLAITFLMERLAGNVDRESSKRVCFATFNAYSHISCQAMAITSIYEWIPLKENSSDISSVSLHLICPKWLTLLNQRHCPSRNGWSC